MLDTPVIENDSVMLDQLQNAVDTLAAAGCVVEKPRPRLISTNTLRLPHVASCRNGRKANDEVFAAALGVDRVGQWRPAVASARRPCDDDVAPEWFQHHNRREGYRNMWEKFFGEYDLLLVQPLPRLHTRMTTPEHERPPHSDQRRK